MNSDEKLARMVCRYALARAQFAWERISAANRNSAAPTAYACEVRKEMDALICDLRAAGRDLWGNFNIHDAVAPDVPGEKP